MTPALRQILLGGGPVPYVDLNFAAGRFKAGSATSGDLAALTGFTFTRASTATYFGANGLLQTASSGAPRLAYSPLTLTALGLPVEEARTNVVLWNRDLTNAAWTASNVTAAKDQTGLDGVANSASSITATAGNGTILQAITLASSARQQSAWVKRLTGSGVVNMTTDNGTTWTAVTVTAGWTQVTIPVQTLANPTVGFRLVTSGDAIAVDYVGNETGTGALSPIETTTVAVTRAADVPILTGLSIPYPASVVVEFATTIGPITATTEAVTIIDSGSGADEAMLYVSGSGSMRLFSETTAALQADLAIGTGMAANTSYRVAGRWKTDDFQGARNGVLGTADTSGTAPATGTRLLVGVRNGPLSWVNGTVSRIRVYNRALTDAELQRLTS